MRKTELDFTGVEPFRDDDEILFLFRPFRSKIFRTCNMPMELRKNVEFVQVANALSIHRGIFKGVYYFLTKDAEDMILLAKIFAYMNIRHIFVEPEFSELSPETTRNN